MNKVSTALLTVLFTTGLIAPGYDGFMHCKCATVLPYFDIKGVRLTNHSTNSSTATNQKVDWTAYILSVQYDVTYVALHEPMRLQPSFSLISSAYACDCVVSGEAGSKEGLKEIWVITKHDFDAQHLANDTVNDLLEVRQYPKNLSLSEYLTGNRPTMREQAFELVLKKKPALNQELKLDVQIKLTNVEQPHSINDPVLVE